MFTVALAVAGGDVVGKMVDGICRLIGPFVGGDSKMLSLVFLISLAGIVLMWLLNENKEGLVVWVLRTGVALAVLINIFTLPTFFNLPQIC